jgi:anaphase-promoting complex subunit 10
MVGVVGMRVYLDFELDESYTPTLIRFAAGTGYHDLQEFSAMRFEQPRGWIDVDWEGVGDADAGDDGVEAAPPALRCMLVQVRVCENHQNGKDTHLRGLQLFARDPAAAPPAEQFAAAARKHGVPAGDLRAYPAAEAWDLEWMEPPVLR